MSGQKKESELNSSNCYLIKYWHYTVWTKIRSGLKDAEPDNSLHAHWHFIVEPSKVELRFWEVAKVLWKLEQLLSIKYWNWFSMADGFQLNCGKLRNRNSSRRGTATKDNRRTTQILSKYIDSNPYSMKSGCVWELLALALAYTQLQVHINVYGRLGEKVTVDFTGGTRLKCKCKCI